MPNDTVLLVVLPDGQVDGVYDALCLSEANAHRALLGTGARVERARVRTAPPTRRYDGTLDYA